MALQNIFIGNMKKYRKLAGITQEKLAELCDTDPCYIGQIETGRRFPSIAYIERIVVALSIAPYQLFYDEISLIKKDTSEEAVSSIRAEYRELMKTVLIESVSQGISSVIDELY